jgi:hypothetical protein
MPSFSGTSPIYFGQAAPAALPAWVSALPLWQWYDIPNTALSSVEPTDANTAPVRGITGPASKISTWCGATLKRVGSVYMLGATGGHGDYFGNEVDGVALNVATPGWVELRAHSAGADLYNLVSINADGRKSSLHTYWATQFDNVNNRMLICSAGGPNTVALPSPPGGYPYNSTSGSVTPKPNVVGAFGMAGNDWLDPLTVAQMPYPISSADFVCANPLTSEIYINASGAGFMAKYSPTANTWTTVGNWYLNGGYCCGVVDPLRNRLLAVGDFNGTRAPEVRSTVDASLVGATFGGLGASALQMSGYPGAVYDEANDSFLLFANGASTIDVLRIDPVTWNVDRPTISGTIANRPNGIHNSVQYVPELRGVVIANSYTGNLKFMRTHA